MGELKADLDLSSSSFKSVVFSPDGKLIAAANEDGRVLIANRAGQLINKLSRHLGQIYDLSFSQDGRYITTAGTDRIVRLWDLSNKFYAQLEGHTGPINSIDFSSDGKLIATCGKDGTIRLWNLSGKQIAQWVAHYANVFEVSFSPDGQHLASTAGDGTIRLWDLSGKLQIQWKAGNPSAIQDSEDFVGIGVRLGVSKQTNTITIADIVKKSPAQKAGVKAGDRILAIDEKSTNGMDIEKVTTLIRGKVNTAVSLLISRDGKNFTLSVNRSRIALSSKKTTAFSISFSSDGQRIVTGESDGIARIRDLSGKQLAELKVNQSQKFEKLAELNKRMKTLLTFPGFKVRFSPDGQQILAGTLIDEMPGLWDLSGHLITLLNAKPRVWDLNFSPDGKYLITGEDRIVRLWNLSGQQIGQLNGHQDVVSGVAFSPDNQRIGTAGEDGTVRLWSLSGQQIAHFYIGEPGLNSLSFSPDGKYVAAAGSNGKAWVWRVENLDELLSRGCNWLSDYLKNNPKASNQDRAICNGIDTEKEKIEKK